MEKEEFQITLEIPDFVKILDESVRKEVLEETEKKIKPDIEKKFNSTVKKIVSKKLELLETPEKEIPTPPAGEEVSEKDTKHCKKCGKEIDKQAKFCRFCGAKI